MKRSQSKTTCVFRLILLPVVVLFLSGCMAQDPAPADPGAYRDRAQSSTSGDVTVTVAVPTIAEARAIYGVDLASKYIQPIWLEVSNRSDDTFWFLPSGMDPDYFSPSEAAFPFKTDKKEINRQLVIKFQSMDFQNPIRPLSTKSGFVLVNLDEGFKAIDIDLVSRREVKNYSFIIADPDFKADFKLVDFQTLYTDEEIIHIEDENELRKVLEELPCCTTNADGDEYGDPLNLILIGEPNDLVPALVRRNWHATEIISARAILKTIKSFFQGERYRYSPISALYVYGRPQDIGWQKARGTVNERNHMRFWMSPIRFRGDRVWVGQISRDIGVKLTFKSPTISTHVIDPDVDEARRYFIEDLAYSQAVARVGHVKGVGVVSREEPRMNLVDDPYYTDGLRAVLFFDSRPYSISDIDILEWETPSGYFKKNN